MDRKPVIGITMGDPNGIGPEVVVKALAMRGAEYDAVVFGSRDVLYAASELAGAFPEYKLVEAFELGMSGVAPGKVDRAAGEASLSYIRAAVAAAMAGEIDAVVTAPISKESTHLAGSPYPGHTEMLKDLTGAENAVMMFEGGKFRVVLVTIHTALSNVPGLITKERVLSTILITHESLRTLFEIDSPRIAVCGLNPHAGESGAFGNEEIVHITPAVLEARKSGIDAEGPYPADTLFYHANKGKWDAVVAMYHDQGLIPFKMLSFEKGVNMTAGLPIIRTSPDHGTAYDIAWKGIADPSSMKAAIDVAAALARVRISKQAK
jgi:4-hydroxythreonine-4-phosphate dehydrogenase